MSLQARSYNNRPQRETASHPVQAFKNLNVLLLKVVFKGDLGSAGKRVRKILLSSFR